MDCSYHPPLCMHTLSSSYATTHPVVISHQSFRSILSVIILFRSAFYFPLVLCRPSCTFLTYGKVHFSTRLDIDCIVNPPLSITRVISNCDFARQVSKGTISAFGRWKLNVSPPPKWTCKIRHSHSQIHFLSFLF